MGSGIVIGQIIGAPETHFRWVKNRIIALNSDRIVPGIVDALDWPPKEFVPNAFYMILEDTPTRAGFGTKATMGMSTLVEWAWMVPGDNLQANQVGRNRGNRFRTNWQMMSELMYGLFPYFCPKETWATAENNGQVTYTGTPLPGETIWWSNPKFSKAQAQDEKKSGILYTVATIGLSQFGDTIQTSSGQGG